MIIDGHMSSDIDGGAVKSITVACYDPYIVYNGRAGRGG